MIRNKFITILSGSGVEISAFDSSYQTILDRGTSQGYTLPSSAQQTIQNQLVLDLKSNGIWDKKDVLYISANDGSEEFGRLNWKSPSVHELTKIGTVTWSSNLGFQGNGTTGAMNTNFSLLNDAVNYTVSEASGSIYNVVQNTIAAGILFGEKQTDSLSKLELIATGTIVNGRINSAAAFTNANDNNNGFLLINRSSQIVSETATVIKDKVEILSKVVTELSPLQAWDVWVGAQNRQDGINLPCNNQWGYFALGGNALIESDTESDLITNYMGAI